MPAEYEICSLVLHATSLNYRSFTCYLPKKVNESIFYLYQKIEKFIFYLVFENEKS